MKQSAWEKGAIYVLALLLLGLGRMCPVQARTHGQDATNQTAPVTNQTGGADCDIAWDQVRHDTFDPAYRSIVGATIPGQTIRLRLRAAQGDLTSARVRVWNDRMDQETYYPMAWDQAFDNDETTFDWWQAEISLGEQTTILYYFFELNDAGDPAGTCTADQDSYVDDDPRFYGGGTGTMSDAYDDQRGFQITVYDPAFEVPEWMQRGIIYQIFPDRFRDGEAENNPDSGLFSYGRSNGAIVRSQYGGQNPSGDWNFEVCDPRGQSAVPCADADGGYYGDNYYGGDLQGIVEKIQDGYLTSLGVSAIYINPIFSAPSNHKYDTANYMEVAPDLGGQAAFEALVQAAQEHGIKLILDGVFNHTSSDSVYFDRYYRYDADRHLTNPNAPGTDDDSGACESSSSPYYAWFYFGGTYGGESGGRCANGTGQMWQDYRAWYGYGSLPKLRVYTPEVRRLFWANGINSVGPFWISQGASGWRLDVGGDVDPGLTRDADNEYWEGFRSAVRAVDGETVIVGEEWDDASPWLLGQEWDSAMNYRLRATLLSWLFTGCSGSGCDNGQRFEDNDSNTSSASGPIQALTPSQFNARLLSIWEDYPPMAFKAMMNLGGSHDTNRLRFLLRKINHDDDATAVQRMKEWWLFTFSYAGAPTLYYGDEIGLNHDGVWANNKWEDDPYNRAPFPWPNTGGEAYSYDSNAQNADLLDFARHMASIRWSYRALQDGEVLHGLILDDAKQLYGFARTHGTQTALIVLNRDDTAHTVTLNDLDREALNLDNGTRMVNALNSQNYQVIDGRVEIDVDSNWGAILLEQAEIEAPGQPSNLALNMDESPTLTWTPVTVDDAGGRQVVTRYTIHQGSSADTAPRPENQVEQLVPPLFGQASRSLSYTLSNAPSGYYMVCAHNAAGQSACSTIQTPDEPKAKPSFCPGAWMLFSLTLVYGGAQSAKVWRSRT